MNKSTLRRGPNLATWNTSCICTTHYEKERIWLNQLLILFMITFMVAVWKHNDCSTVQKFQSLWKELPMTNQKPTCTYSVHVVTVGVGLYLRWLACFGAHAMFHCIFTLKVINLSTFVGRPNNAHLHEATKVLRFIRQPWVVALILSSSWLYDLLAKIFLVWNRCNEYNTRYTG